MAARFCSKCGREIASTAQFCSGCGTPVSSGPQVTRVEAATNSTRRLLIPGMIAALVVLVIAVVVLARPHPLVTAAHSEQPPVAPAITNAPAAPAPAAPAITNAPSLPAPVAPAVTNAPAKPAPALPPEDARYLAFLQQIEQRRVAETNDTSEASSMQAAVGQLQGAQTDPDQVDNQEANIKQTFGKLNQGYTDYQMKWQALIKDFRSYPPPPDCTDIANKYFAALTQYADIISKTQIMLQGIQMSTSGTPDYGSIIKLQPVLQQAQTQVNADLTGADGAISQLCTRYNVPKPFSIQVEGASSPLTGI